MASRSKVVSLKAEFWREYQALRNAVDRCNRITHPQYGDYGGRGIFVCAEWECIETGFAAFLDEVGPKPYPWLELDRIDNNRGYYPGNVRWVDRSTNLLNRRAPTNVIADLGWGIGRYQMRDKNGKPHTFKSPLVPFNGEIVTLHKASVELQIAVPTLRQRFQRGWGPERSLTPTLFCPRGKPRIN